MVANALLHRLQSNSNIRYKIVQLSCINASRTCSTSSSVRTSAETGNIRTSLVSKEPEIQHETFVLYKPDGYLSQFVNNGQIKKRQRMLGELTAPYNLPVSGLMPVGRLDEQSEGLLLLTTDGKLSFAVTSSGTVEKEYYAQVDGIISEEAVHALSQGVEITSKGHTETHWARPSCVSILSPPPDLPPRRRRIRDSAAHGPTSWLSIVLTEGKNRQVRRMTAAVGFPTLRLVRVRIGMTKLESLLPGEVRIHHGSIGAFSADDA